MFPYRNWFSATFYSQSNKKLYRPRLYAGYGQIGSPLIQFIAFGMYNNKIKNATSRADWLLYNEEERDKYLNDPHIPAQITASLMYELLSGMINCVSKKAKTASLAPVYILSGSDDAVSEYGKNIKTTVNLMTKQGFNIKDIVIFNNSATTFYTKKIT